jgi:TonB family protein
MRQSRGKRGLIGPFLGLSLLVHLHVVLLIVAFFSLNPDGCTADDLDFAPIEVALVPASSEPPELEPEELKKEEEKEQQEEQDAKGQVVELPKPHEERRPDNARFRSEYDSKVQKETKAPPQPFKPGKIVANRPLPVRERPSSPPTPEEQRRIERKVMKLAMRTRPEIPRSELEQQERGDEPARTEERRGPKVEQAPKTAPRRQASIDQLRLSDEELAKALGTPVNDAIDGVEEGAATLLNSKRWRFASFFNRVKRQVAQNWHPDRAYRRRDPTGNVYGFRDRLTILRVQLTPAGELVALHVEKASGVGFLDDEAIAAFRAAEPFPNPPKGLVNKDTGSISFRFGFLFEISRRPTFRVFRYRN